jgi:hypothetical protein
MSAEAKDIASNVIDTVSGCSCDDCLGNASKIIARAIMVERERCAQAFVSVAADAADGNRPLPLDIMKAVVRGIRMTTLEPAWGPAVRAATRESHASLYAAPGQPTGE